MRLFLNLATLADAEIDPLIILLSKRHMHVSIKYSARTASALRVPIPYYRPSTRWQTSRQFMPQVLHARTMTQVNVLDGHRYSNEGECTDSTATRRGGGGSFRERNGSQRARRHLTTTGRGVGGGPGGDVQYLNRCWRVDL